MFEIIARKPGPLVLIVVNSCRAVTRCITYEINDVSWAVARCLVQQPEISLGVLSGKRCSRGDWGLQKSLREDALGHASKNSPQTAKRGRLWGRRLCTDRERAGGQRHLPQEARAARSWGTGSPPAGKSRVLPAEHSQVGSMEGASPPESQVSGRRQETQFSSDRGLSGVSPGRLLAPPACRKRGHARGP